MKFNLIENDGCFCINMTAETMEDAAKLVRFGMNATKQLNSQGASADKDGSFSGWAIFAKNRRASNYIPRRK